MFFGSVLISDLYFFQEIVLLSPCFKCSKNWCFRLQTKHLELFIWNVALVVNITPLVGTGGLVLGLLIASGVFDNLDVIQFFDHVKSVSVSQLIKLKSRYLKKLLKYFNVTTTSASNLLLSPGVLPIISVYYSKDLLDVKLPCFYLSCNY